MRELGQWRRHGMAALLQDSQNLPERIPTQRQHDPRAGQQVEFFLEKPAASITFFGQRLVGRRSATDDGSDVGAKQPQSIVTIGRLRLAGVTPAGRRRGVGVAYGTSCEFYALDENSEK